MVVKTIEETAASFGEDLEPWQHEINVAWLRQVHATLQEGGVWGSPELERAWIKRGEGFEEIDFEEL